MHYNICLEHLLHILKVMKQLSHERKSDDVIIIIIIMIFYDLIIK